MITDIAIKLDILSAIAQSESITPKLAIGDVIFIALSSLIILALLIHTIRRPQWLNKTGRAPGISIEPAFLILCINFLAVPFVRIFIFQWFQSSPDLAEPTVQDKATWFWIGYLLSIPIILIWWVAHHRPLTDHQSNTAAHSITRTPKPLLTSLAASLIIFILIIPVLALINLISAQIRTMITGEEVSQIAHDTLKLLQDESLRDPWIIAIITAIIIAAPIIEEVLYRGTIQALLRHSTRSAWTSILITAVLFGGIHIFVVAPESIPSLITLGLALGLAYEYTGRLIAPVMIHILFNLANIVLLYSLPTG